MNQNKNITFSSWKCYYVRTTGQIFTDSNHMLAEHTLYNFKICCIESMDVRIPDMRVKYHSESAFSPNAPANVLLLWSLVCINKITFGSLLRISYNHDTHKRHCQYMFDCLLFGWVVRFGSQTENDLHTALFHYSFWIKWNGDFFTLLITCKKVFCDSLFTQKETQAFEISKPSLHSICHCVQGRMMAMDKSKKNLATIIIESEGFSVIIIIVIFIVECICAADKWTSQPASQPTNQPTKRDWERWKEFYSADNNLTIRGRVNGKCIQKLDYYY